METYTLADLDPTAVVSPTQVAVTQQRAHVSLIDQIVSEAADAYLAGKSPEDVVRQYEPRLAEMLADAEVQAWLLGGGAVAYQPGPKRSTPLSWVWSTVRWAADSIFGRKVLQPQQFYQLDAKARRKHFTVSGRHTDEVIERIRDGLANLVATGPSLQKAREVIREAIAGKGSPLSRGHVETIYRTTTNAAFNDAQWTMLQHPEIRKQYPYVMDVSIPDQRRSELCAYMATAGIDGGPIYRTDDPVYAKWKPLRHFNCRCGFTVISAADAERYGIVGNPKHKMTPPPDKIARQGKGFVG